MPLQAASVLLLPDLSEWQPDADMAGIKTANGGAAIIRACYGADHPDTAFGKLRAAASGYKFLGLYIYIVATQPLDAQLQAFAAIVGELADGEIPVVDLEVGSGSQAARARQALGWLDTRFGLGARPVGQRSWLYSGLSFAEAHGLTPIFESGQRRTWLAAYSATEPALAHTLWQCTDGKRGSHITTWPGAGTCDTSAYHGTLDELAALITPKREEDDDMLSGTLLADQATPLRWAEGRPCTQLLLSVAEGAPAQRLTVSIRDEAGTYTETVSVTWEDPGVLRFRHPGKVKAVSIPQPTTPVSYLLF